MALLEVKGIKKNFGDLEVLKGIDFELNKGEVLVIIGSSGSGKTTLLRCLNFLETADEGKITINGEVLFDGSEHIDKRKRRKYNRTIREKRLHFGLVFQQFNLFPHYNVITNIKLASELLAKEKMRKECKQISEKIRGLRNEARAEYRKTLANKKSDCATKTDFNSAKQQLKLEFTKKLKEELTAVSSRLQEEALSKVYGDGDNGIESRAYALLDRVGLSDKAKSYPCELSGGQQQRVAIARALALSPDILCFDEPTSALDPELTEEVLRVIKGLKSTASTLIAATHEMDFARNVADKVIFMADGVIEEMGTPHQIFEDPQSEKTKDFLNKSADNFDTKEVAE